MWSASNSVHPTSYGQRRSKRMTENLVRQNANSVDWSLLRANHSGFRTHLSINCELRSSGNWLSTQGTHGNDHVSVLAPELKAVGYYMQKLIYVVWMTYEKWTRLTRFQLFYLDLHSTIHQFHLFIWIFNHLCGTHQHFFYVNICMIIHKGARQHRLLMWTFSHS